MSELSDRERRLIAFKAHQEGEAYGRSFTTVDEDDEGNYPCYDLSEDTTHRTFDEWYESNWNVYLKPLQLTILLEISDDSIDMDLYSKSKAEFKFLQDCGLIESVEKNLYVLSSYGEDFVKEILSTPFNVKP